jgi:glycosyltransferase involved in cell wall biosynthesis
MNIGIYLGNQKSGIGGGYSLIETIKKEIFQYNGKNSLFIFYRTRSLKMKFTEDNITYVNMWPKRIKKQPFKKNNIDLMIFLVPTKMECEVPFIFTVWDLGHRMLPCFPEVSQNGQFKSREETYQYMLPRATYILTGNETGKKEILANYAINAEKIKTVAFPITGFCFEKIDIPERIDFIKEPFVFYPAQFWTHKNHITIVKAISYLKKEKKVNINCYFAGIDYGNLENVNNCIRHHDLEEQIKILDFVDYSTLMYLYKNALAMVYVSLLGPNNLPPLEAVALSCPLIVSNLPGHIEQMAGAGLFVNPLDSQEIAEAILKFYKESDFRANMIDKGLEFAKKFKEYSYFGEVLKIVDEFEILINKK